MKPRILLCSHDAGGANLLLAWALEHPNNSYLALLSGPAVGIYSASNLIFNSIDSIESIPRNISQFICSTGWQTDFEKILIEHCVSNNKKVAVYLDHWVNYRARFVFKNHLLVPDQIWVVDEEALIVATKEMPEVHKIKVIGNYYEETIINNIKNNSPPSKNSASILLCLEPIRENIDVVALWDDLVNFLQFKCNGCQFIIRPHPSGELDGSEYLKDKLASFANVRMSRCTLEADLACCRTVIGYQSSIFSIAHKLNKEVISYFPAQAMKPLLPHAYINYIPSNSSLKESLP